MSMDVLLSQLAISILHRLDRRLLFTYEQIKDTNIPLLTHTITLSNDTLNTQRSIIVSRQGCE